MLLDFILINGCNTVDLLIAGHLVDRRVANLGDTRHHFLADAPITQVRCHFRIISHKDTIEWLKLPARDFNDAIWALLRD